MAKYNHKKDIVWEVKSSNLVLNDVKDALKEKNAPMTFLDAIEETRTGITYDSDLYGDCLNSTYYSYNDTSYNKVVGIYSEFEHFKSLDLEKFDSKVKKFFGYFYDFYEKELHEYRLKRVDDLPTNLKNKLEKFYQDLGDVIEQTIEKEFDLTIDLVNEYVDYHDDTDDDLYENRKLTFKQFINESKTSFKE